MRLDKLLGSFAYMEEEAQGRLAAQDRPERGESMDGESARKIGHRLARAGCCWGDVEAVKAALFSVADDFIRDERRGDSKRAEESRCRAGVEQAAGGRGRRRFGR